MAAIEGDDVAVTGGGATDGGAIRHPDEARGHALPAVGEGPSAREVGADQVALHLQAVHIVNDDADGGVA